MHHVTEQHAALVAYVAIAFSCLRARRQFLSLEKTNKYYRLAQRGLRMKLPEL